MYVTLSLKSFKKLFKLHQNTGYHNSWELKILIADTKLNVMHTEYECITATRRHLLQVLSEQKLKRFPKYRTIKLQSSLFINWQVHKEQSDSFELLLMYPWTSAWQTSIQLPF